MRDATLVMVFQGEGQEKEILLAKKKRGFGMDKWNGPGGKVDSAIGETPEECIIRETKEEVALTLQEVDQVGEFDFIFPHAPTKNFHCYLFLSEKFTGVATESEEMLPRWFKVSEIPYKDMWDGDRIWMPLILAGKKLKGSISFDEYGKVIDHKLTELT